MTSRFHSRANQAWAALTPCFRLAGERYVVHEPRRRSSVPLWPFSQVLHAATVLSEHDDKARSDLPRLQSTLETFRRGTAYSERPGNRRRYYDDNAWIALAALDDTDSAQGYALADRLLGFLREGARDFGHGRIGIGWVEGGSTYNACSTGSTGLAAARLAELSPSVRASHRGLAAGCLSFISEVLTNDHGLVSDHLRVDGSVDGGLYSYNQGLTLGLHAALGDLRAAAELAGRTTDYFSGERLWSHPPAFNAVLVRELLRLNELAPDSRWRQYCDTYLDRVWEETRDPSTGLFSIGGIGHYDDGRVLDHAALVGAMATRARSGD